MQGLSRLSAQSCSGGSSSPRSGRASTSAREPSCNNATAAPRQIRKSARLQGCSQGTPSLPRAIFGRGANFGQHGAHYGASHRSHRIRGGRLLARLAPRAAPCARSPAGRSGRAARGRGGRARGPAHRARASRLRSRASPPTTSCTRWRPANGGDFAARDRRAAEAFAGAAATAGVERIVYLGGIAPRASPEPTCARGSRSRRSCSTRVPGSTALRASIVSAPGRPRSACSCACRALRVLPMPGWRSNRTQPIDERDVIEYPPARRHARRRGPLAGRLRSGRDDLREMIERIAEPMGVGGCRWARRLTHPAGERGGAAVTGQPLELVRPLMESLEIGHPAARPRGGAAALRPAAAPASSAPSSTHWPSGSAASRWRRDEGRAHDRDRRAAEEVYDVVMDPSRLGDWVTIHDHLEDAPNGSSSRGRSSPNA